MQLTISTVLHAIYSPIRHQVSQRAFFCERLFRDYYLHDPHDTSKDNAIPNDHQDLTDSNISEILNNKRLFPMPVCAYYLTRKDNLEHNVTTQIVKFKKAPQDYPQTVNHTVYQLVQTSSIHPLDKAYLAQFYTPFATEAMIGKFLSEVIWYVMQVQRTLPIAQAA